MSEVVYEPPAPHYHSLPPRDAHRKGTAARCADCGGVFVLHENEYASMSWRPLLPWPFDRAVRRALREEKR